MNDLVINEQSRLTLGSLVDNLPQALLLTGEEGIGLATIARALGRARGAVVSVVLPTDKDGAVDIEKGSIRVASIRDLYDQTRTKQSQSQVIIIDFAERMSLGSQNAFLKLLEEPNSSTYFILASHRPDDLLPTVRSRTQRINLQPISHGQSTALLDVLGVTDPAKKAKLLFIAEGLPAELVRLTADETYFDKRAAIMTDARSYLSANAYDKLLIINKYKDSRSDALALIQSIITIARRIMSTKPEPSLIKQLDLLTDAYERIRSNQNIRLQLARIVL